MSPVLLYVAVLIHQGTLFSFIKKYQPRGFSYHARQEKMLRHFPIVLSKPQSCLTSFTTRMEDMEKRPNNASRINPINVFKLAIRVHTKWALIYKILILLYLIRKLCQSFMRAKSIIDL